MKKISGRIPCSSGYHLDESRIWQKAGRRTSRMYEAKQKAEQQVWRGRVELNGVPIKTERQKVKAYLDKVDINLIR